MTASCPRPVKFLLVDDRPENLLALDALLRRDGLELLHATSGIQALEILLQHEVALALLDVQMPEMDGFALAELMRGAERTRHVPIIFLTAAPQEQNRVFRGYDAGAVDFLFKPLDPIILRHKTETFFQLHRQRQQLEETLRLNETFVAAVGHDLRNPLSAMMMAADLILATSREAVTLSTARRLRSSGQRMTRMIEDLFDLSRARRGQIPIERKATDALAVVRRVIDEHESTPQRPLLVQVDGEDFLGQFDEGRLAQIVSNLVGNALRHGDPAAPIGVHLSATASSIRLSVHNGGVIPADLVPRLFDPFRSGHTSRRSEGLGLGLYIVHQLVLAHEGTIEVRSDEATGTTFTVTLPR